MISVTKFQMKIRQYDQYEAKSNMKNKNYETKSNMKNKNFEIQKTKIKITKLYVQKLASVYFNQLDNSVYFNEYGEEIKKSKGKRILEKD